MKNLTPSQSQIVEILTKKFEAIEKAAALQYIKKEFGSFFSLSDILVAYKHAFEF